MNGRGKEKSQQFETFLTFPYQNSLWIYFWLQMPQILKKWLKTKIQLHSGILREILFSKILRLWNFEGTPNFWKGFCGMTEKLESAYYDIDAEDPRALDKLYVLLEKKFGMTGHERLNEVGS